MEERKFDERSLKNLEGVHPDSVKVLTEAIKDSPIPFIVIFGVRTVAEQQALYAQGRTVAGLKVTNCDGVNVKSEHQVKDDGYGYATDLYADANSNGKLDAPELNDVASLICVASHIKAKSKTLGIAIEWGGDWKMKDYPHFQLKK